MVCCGSGLKIRCACEHICFELIQRGLKVNGHVNHEYSTVFTLLHVYMAWQINLNLSNKCLLFHVILVSVIFQQIIYCTSGIA